MALRFLWRTKLPMRSGGDLRQPRTKVVSDRYAILAIAVAGLLRFWAGAALGFRPLDDAYISFRYAINLAAGRGFVYNLNDWVLGTTTPLWTLALAAMSRVGLPLETWALILSLAADVATAVLLWRLLAGLEYSTSVSLGAALLFLCMFDYFSLARSGMETSCFVFSSWRRCTRSQPTGSRPPACCAASRLSRAQKASCSR